MLFAGSLSDNISFFDPQPDMPWLLQCAQMAAIHDDIQAMPMGYNTLVGDMGTPVFDAVPPTTVCSTDLSTLLMIQSRAREIMVGMLISASTTRVALAILLSSS